MKKFFRRTLTALLIVTVLLTASIVGAAVQMFDGKGEWHTSDAENQQIAQQRAQQRAQLDAQKKAGVYLKTFSRSVNMELAEDEITAVTNNIIEIVGDVHFDKKTIPLSDNQTTILYTATLKAKIDPDGILDFVKRDSEQKVTIVGQNKQLQDAIAKNDELAASLTEQYNRATSQAERDRIREQMKQADREFLANRKNEEAVKLYYAKNDDGAIKLLDEALELNPNFATAYNNRGCTYARMKQYERAIRDLNKAVELMPNEAGYYNNRGDVYFDCEQYEQAIRDFNTTINIDLKNNVIPRGAIYKRGAAYFELGQYDEAVHDFQLMDPDDPDPDDAQWYQLRGLCYQKLGDEAKAKADFAQVEKLNALREKISTFRLNLFERYNVAKSQAEKDRLRKQMSKDEREFLSRKKFREARKLSSDEDYDGAIKLYNEALHLNPNNEEAYLKMSECYRELKDYENAFKNAVKPLQLNPNSDDCYDELDEILDADATYESDEAKLNFWKKVLQAVPKSDRAYFKMGECYDDLEDYENALKSFAKAIQLNPNNPDYYNERASIFEIDLEDYERAVAEYKEILKIKFDDAEKANREYSYANQKIGNIYKRRLKDYKQAIDYFTKMIELAPLSPYAYTWRAQCYKELGENEKAQADFRQAIECFTRFIENPNQKRLGRLSDLYSERGDLWKELGENEKAQADFAKAKELRSKNR